MKKIRFGLFAAVGIVICGVVFHRLSKADRSRYETAAQKARATVSNSISIAPAWTTNSVPFPDASDMGATVFWTKEGNVRSAIRDGQLTVLYTLVRTNKTPLTFTETYGASNGAVVLLRKEDAKVTPASRQTTETPEKVDWGTNAPAWREVESTNHLFGVFVDDPSILRTNGVFTILRTGATNDTSKWPKEWFKATTPAIVLLRTEVVTNRIPDRFEWRSSTNGVDTMGGRLVLANQVIVLGREEVVTNLILGYVENGQTVDLMTVRKP